MVLAVSYVALQHGCHAALVGARKLTRIDSIRMRVVRLFIAVGTIVVVAAVWPSCHSAPTVTTTGPSQPVVTRVAISGASTIAPGSTAQLSAVATYSDGSQKDVTATVQWHSSNTSILTVSATGLASGIQSGDVVVTAMLTGIPATQVILVVPTGTFRLSGTVTGFGELLAGALVQVTGGVGAGLSVVTTGGLYRLYGVAGNVGMTVSKDAYVTITKTLTVSGNTDNVNFDLAPVNPPPSLAGTYTLRITADAACATDGAGALPSIGRDRRYTATIDETETRLHVVLAGANFLSGANSMYGQLALDGTTTFYVDSYFYYKTFDVAEVLPDGSGDIYFLSGDITAARSGNNLIGTLNGDIKVKVSASGSVVGYCTSTHHAVTFTNQSSGPARTRSRR